MAFEIPKINMFTQQPMAPIAPIGGHGTQHAGGLGKTERTQSPFEADMANFRSFLPQNNGTGELRPLDDREGLRTLGYA